jgi:hypothetical protein
MGCLQTRVTRIGEFLLNGSLYTFGSYIKISEMAQIPRLLFSTVKVMHKFGQKMCWATFWAIFSQPHFVTLFQTIYYCGLLMPVFKQRSVKIQFRNLKQERKKYLD